MKKERFVILFGAGAISDWGAPSTSILTELVKKRHLFLFAMIIIKQV
jgi:hypothetical protein